tara:strand:+ start:425 stop:673 length:249 start_codon:yes stop_codon:yes gene_type:complete
MRIYDIDTLAMMNDYELEKVFRMCKSKIKSENSSKNRSARKENIGNLETEYCYIKRELEIRDARRHAHQEYLSTLPRKAYHP